MEIGGVDTYEGKEREGDTWQSGFGNFGKGRGSLVERKKTRVVEVSRNLVNVPGSISM